MAFMENYARFLPEAVVIREVTTKVSGYITAIDGEALGNAVVGLGGGRRVEKDVVDPAVGLSSLAGLGDKVGPGVVLGVVHAARSDQADAAEAALRRAYSIGSSAPDPVDLIHAAVD